jgi:hypothetical protein
MVVVEQALLAFHHLTDKVKVALLMRQLDKQAAQLLLDDSNANNKTEIIAFLIETPLFKKKEERFFCFLQKAISVGAMESVNCFV